MDSYGGGLGCGVVAVVVVALLVVGGLAVFLPDKIADIQNAEARRIEARAELAEVRAAAEHQRAVDGETRYMLHVATLAAFTGSPGVIANEYCAGGLLGVVAFGCLMALFYVFKQGGNGLQ